MSSIIERLIKKIFKKKPVALKTDEFAIVRLSESAKEKGIEDDENKEIHIMKHRKVINKVPYFKGAESVIRQVHGIPIINESLDYEQPYEFKESASFGQTTRRRFL